MSNPTPDPPLITPGRFANLVSRASDEQLEAGLAANGELIIAGIFAAMPDQFRAEASGDLAAVARWRIIHPKQSEPDIWQVTIRAGRCITEHGATAEPDITYTLSAVNFVKLTAGVVDGPQLFVVGAITIDGDILLATRMPTLFTAPGKNPEID